MYLRLMMLFLCRELKKMLVSEIFSKCYNYFFTTSIYSNCRQTGWQYCSNTFLELQLLKYWYLKRYSNYFHNLLTGPATARPPKHSTQTTKKVCQKSCQMLGLNMDFCREVRHLTKVPLIRLQEGVYLSVFIDLL